MLVAPMREHTIADVQELQRQYQAAVARGDVAAAEALRRQIIAAAVEVSSIARPDLPGQQRIYA